jgi:hypothetical protein
MTLASIKERLSQKPFRPFALETIGGAWIDVNHEADCAIFERNGRAQIFAFAQSGEMYVLEPDQVVSLAMRDPDSHQLSFLPGSTFFVRLSILRGLMPVAFAAVHGSECLNLLTDSKNSVARVRFAFVRR